MDEPIDYTKIPRTVKFTLRMPSFLYKKIAELAEKEGVSVQEWITKRLETHG